MKVLLIGSGGRESALHWHLRLHSGITEFYSIPGNGGICEKAECPNILLNDLDGITAFAKEREVDLAIIGPEAPLVGGLADRLTAAGIKTFGPNAKAAQMEGSKEFAKNLLTKYNIPTGKAEMFEVFSEAVLALEHATFPLVIKADGLAAGKGVFVCETKDQAHEALSDCLIEKKFEDAGARVLMEEYLEGREASILVLVDGKDYVPLNTAMDYKRAYDKDAGPNTGGMGCISPNPYINDTLMGEILNTIIEPTIKAMISEGIDYRGVLYAGLMLTKDGPKVLEFNARFGDPETQTILPLLKGDLIEIFSKTIAGDLKNLDISWSREKCVTVTMAAKGYPGEYPTGEKIHGLDEADLVPGVEIYHAGTKFDGMHFLTSGGRVINVSAVGESYSEARNRAYEGVKSISYHSKFTRSDIAEDIAREFG